MIQKLSSADLHGWDPPAASHGALTQRMTTLAEYQQRATPDDLTVIMVCWRTAALVKRNVEATKNLNLGQRVWWLVIENSQEGNDAESIEGVIRLPGTSITEAERATIGWGSFHHAKSLNVGLAYARTDWILIVDPDCFVIQPDWIKRVRKMMKEKGLVFWGTPYHPERFGRFNAFGQQYMYFPTAICMMIDRGRLQRHFHKFVLDFTPPFSGRRNVIAYREEVRDLLRGRRVPVNYRLARGWGRLLGSYGLRGFIDALGLSLRRWAAGKNPDTGYMLYEQYHNLVPYGVTSVNYTRRTPTLFWLWKWAVPQKWCGFPKRNGHWTSVGDKLIPNNLVGRGRWEVFVWNEEPFAVHLGSVGHGEVIADLSPLEAILGECTAAHAKAA